MQMWHLPIPKILHVAWGCNPIHPLRMLTIETFHKLNPDWEIWLHTRTDPGPPTWETGENKQYDTGPAPVWPEWVKVIVRQVDIPISDVQFSDLTRWARLFDTGGVWSDMDIIYTKPMDSLPFNKPGMEHEAYLCEFGKIWRHKIGFLMAKPYTRFINFIYWLAFRRIDKNKYQSAGADLLNKMDLTIAYNRCMLFNMPRNTVYPYTAEQIFDYSGSKLRLPPDSIGLHWFAGHPFAMQHMNKPGKNLISRLTENI